LQTDIQTKNSVPVDQERKIDVTSLMSELNKTVNDMIRLKITIFVASMPVRETILRMAELKSKVAFLKGIDVHEGKGKDTGSYRMSEQDIEFGVEYDIIWKREEIEKCEAQIDAMQEELDTFNHKTEIEF